MSENFEADTVNYREEILRLVAEGKIKHTSKRLPMRLLDEQLDETNEHITNTLIRQLCELLTSLELEG